MTLLRVLARGSTEPLVFWHTGGITGALAALERRGVPDAARSGSDRHLAERA
jgi:hypothetical protein